MNPAVLRPLFGVLLAIAVTTAMDATGLAAFSALPLCPLMVGFWILQHFSRADMGFERGRWRDYGIAVSYPLLVLGVVAVVSIAAGAASPSTLNWRKALINIAVAALATMVVATVTEEGFFRGWLWASLRRAKNSELRSLLYCSAAFALWHLSWVTLTADKLPIAQVPIFILNAAVIGMIWGLLRWISGSVLVASVSHGVWNGLDYVLFGFGTKSGMLGIANTAVFGPEVGILGLAVNGIFAAALLCSRSRLMPSAAATAEFKGPGGLSA